MAKRKRRRPRRRCFRGHIRYGLSGPGGVFSQEEYQKSLQQPPIIRYRGEIVDKLPEEAKATPQRPRRKVGKRRSTRVGRDASRSNDRLESQPWRSGYSGFAYIRAELPAPEPWHQQIPPWEDPPTSTDSTSSSVDSDTEPCSGIPCLWPSKPPSELDNTGV
jgi:hypothetical protein